MTGGAVQIRDAAIEMAAMTPSCGPHDTRVGKLLRFLLALNAGASIAAAAVLAVAPTAIPRAVGIAGGTPPYLMAYLLAAAEFAVGALSVLAACSRDVGPIRQAVLVVIVFHAASGLAGAAAIAEGGSILIWWNVAVRAAMVVVLAAAMPSYPGSRKRPSEH